MNNKIIKQIKRIGKYQKNYIEQIKKANDTIPIIKKNLEFVEWAENTVKGAPENFNNQNIEAAFNLIEDSIKETIPDLSINPKLIGGTVSAANASLSEVVFDRINGGAIDQNRYSTWINESNESYQIIQKKQNIIAQISTMLTTLGLKDEFLEAVNKFSKFESGIALHQDVAILMRNVLEGLQGSLFDIVRKNNFIRQAKKNVRWEQISNFLSSGGSGSRQSQLLLSKKSIFIDIHSVLSQIAKNSIQNPVMILNTYYSKWLDFLYTTLNLINPKFLS